MQFPFGLWDFSLWTAVAATILIVTSEVISPYYGRSGIVLNRRRLRLAAIVLALIFLGTIALRTYEILKS